MRHSAMGSTDTHGHAGGARHGLAVALLVAVLGGLTSTARGAQTVFFSENFDDTNFASRGWYDSTGGAVDTANHAPTPSGNPASFNCHWNLSGTDCAGGTPHRHLFTATNTVYVSFWMKLGSATVTWQDSGEPFHPHIIQILTDADSST